MSDLAEQVTERLDHIRRHRPSVGLRAGVRYLSDTLAAVIGGVAMTTLLAVAGGLMTGTTAGGGIGAVIGLLFSAKLLSRPNRDWRTRLTKEGFTVKRLELEGPATQVEIMRTESARLAYLLHPAGAQPESLLIDVGLPEYVQFNDRQWQFLVDASDRPRLHACVTFFIDYRCRTWIPPLRIVDGLARVELHADFERLEELIESLMALADNLRDPLTALRSTVESIIDYDIVRAAAALIHEGHAYFETPLTTWVTTMLSGRVTDALSLSKREDFNEETVVRALRESEVPTDAWYAPLVYFARRLPSDESSALRAVALLNAAGALNGVDRLKWLQKNGTIVALRRLKDMQWSDALRTAGEQTMTVLMQRFDLHGALAVDTQGDGGLAFAETGQLSAPED